MANFIGITRGLMASHHSIKKLVMARANFFLRDDGEITVIAINGRNLERMHKIPTTTITQEQYANRPTDNLDEACWALDLLGFETGGSPPPLTHLTAETRIMTIQQCSTLPLPEVEELDVEEIEITQLPASQ